MSNQVLASRPARSIAIAAVTLLTGTTLGAIMAPSSAQAWTPRCSGTSEYVAQVEVKRSDTGSFAVVLTPTQAARDHSAWVIDQRPVVVEQWHAIQDCVADLEGDIADSIWQQLECHQIYAWIPDSHGGYATGSTFDLETNRPKLENPNVATYTLAKCGGYLGKNLEWSEPRRPDDGVLDLEGAWSNIA